MLTLDNLYSIMMSVKINFIFAPVFQNIEFDEQIR